MNKLHSLMSVLSKEIVLKATISLRCNEFPEQHVHLNRCKKYNYPVIFLLAIFYCISVSVHDVILNYNKKGYRKRKRLGEHALPSTQYL